MFFSSILDRETTTPATISEHLFGIQHFMPLLSNPYHSSARQLLLFALKLKNRGSVVPWYMVERDTNPDLANSQPAFPTPRPPPSHPAPPPLRAAIEANYTARTCCSHGACGPHNSSSSSTTPPVGVRVRVLLTPTTPSILRVCGPIREQTKKPILRLVSWIQQRHENKFTAHSITRKEAQV